MLVVALLATGESDCRLASSLDQFTNLEIPVSKYRYQNTDSWRLALQLFSSSALHPASHEGRDPLFDTESTGTLLKVLRYQYLYSVRRTVLPQSLIVDTRTCTSAQYPSTEYLYYTGLYSEKSTDTSTVASYDGTQ